MDPLTHTLVGANLSATRLGEKTRFATAALVVGANLPDVDGICYFIDQDLALYFRRGWTHGILALLILPLLQASVLKSLARFWPAEDDDGGPPADFKWLLLLSTIAIWSHPALDWLNTYGMRWLMPFDGRWFYGDAVYIMDVCLWLILGLGYLAGQQATRSLLTTGSIIGAWILWMVWRRSPEHIGLVFVIIIVFGIALVWKKPVRRPQLAQRLATIALVVASVYIGGRLLMNELTESAVIRQFAQRGETATKVMVGPDRFNPLRWTVVARTGDVYRYGRYDWATRAFTLEPGQVPVWRDSPEWRRAIQDPSVRGLVTWLRFPAYQVERQGTSTLVHIIDARRTGGGRRATVVLTE